jgi:hypothetical protein
LFALEELGKSGPEAVPTIIAMLDDPSFGAEADGLIKALVKAGGDTVDQHVQAFARQLTDFIQVEVLNGQGQFTFFRRLLVYDDWRVAGRPQSTQFLDYQVNSDIEWLAADRKLTFRNGYLLTQFFLIEFKQSLLVGLSPFCGSNIFVRFRFF